MIPGLPLLGDQNLDLVFPLLDIVRDASDLGIHARRKDSHEAHQVHAFDPRCFKTHGEGVECVLLRDEGLHALVGALEIVQELPLLDGEVRERGALLETPDLLGRCLEEHHRTIQALFDEVELALGTVSDPIPSEALQCGRRSVEDLRCQDRVGPPVGHNNDVRRFEGLGRQPALHLTLDLAGGMNHQSEAPVLTGRGLRGQPEQPDVENRADRARGEFPTSGVQDPDLRSFVIVCEFQTDISHIRIDPGTAKQLRANQVRLFREHTQSQFVHHPAGDLNRGQYLDLRLDGIHEEVDTAQPPRLPGELPGDLVGIVDLYGAVRFVDRALLRYRPDGRGRRHTEDQYDKPKTTDNHLPVVGDVR